MRRRAAAKAWADILPSLVDPYLQWKNSGVTSKHSDSDVTPEVTMSAAPESDTYWSIQVLGLEGM